VLFGLKVEVFDGMIGLIERDGARSELLGTSRHS